MCSWSIKFIGDTGRKHINRSTDLLGGEGRTHNSRRVKVSKNLCAWNKLCVPAPPPRISSPSSAKGYYLRSPRIFHGSCNKSHLPAYSKNLKEFINPIVKVDFSLPDTVYKKYLNNINEVPNAVKMKAAWNCLYRFPKGCCFQNIPYYSILNLRINES